MRAVKIVSRILFYISRLLCLLYFGMALQSLISLSTGWSLLFKDGKKYFKVCLPFTQHPYLVGDYNIPYIIFDFLLPLSLYGLFFLLLGNVFKVFFQPKLFTRYGVKQLKLFYICNFVLPATALLLAGLFTEIDDIAAPLVFFHFILGIFAFFLAAIFTQGLHLQNEQDLFI
jgi:hypothetical protein